MKKILLGLIIGLVVGLPVGVKAYQQLRDVNEIYQFNCDSDGYSQGCAKVGVFDDGGNKCYISFDGSHNSQVQTNSSISCVKR